MSKVWTTKQANEYFLRNLAHYSKPSDPSSDVVLEALATMEIYAKHVNQRKHARVLEIGCTNGHRLSYLKKTGYAEEVHGYEFSPAAIDDGRSRFDLEINQGRFPKDFIPTFPFDVIIASYVFMYIPRTCLLQAIKKIDESLREGGLLVLNDFCPRARSIEGMPVSVPAFKTNESDCRIWKADLAAMFMSTGCYRPMWYKDYDHAPSGKLCTSAQCVVLRKETMYEEES